VHLRAYKEYRQTYPKNRQPGKTDWKRVEALTDEQIERAAGSDPDAAPILDKEWFKTAKLVMPEPQPRKEFLTIRLDRKVIHWFKA
jgi:uncharacterized protein (DUF4415 family)